VHRHPNAPLVVEKAEIFALADVAVRGLYSLVSSYVFAESKQVVVLRVQLLVVVHWRDVAETCCLHFLETYLLAEQKFHFNWLRGPAEKSLLGSLTLQISFLNLTNFCDRHDAGLHCEFGVLGHTCVARPHFLPQYFYLLVFYLFCLK
jgi:hypothetical protein